MNLIPPKFRNNGDSFTVTYGENSLVFFLSMIGLCILILGVIADDFYYAFRFGLLIMLSLTVAQVGKVWRIRFNAATRTLTLEKAWSLRKKTYDMNLLQGVSIKDPPKDFRRWYKVDGWLALRLTDHERDLDLGPFATIGEIERLRHALEVGLGHSIPTVQRYDLPFFQR